MPLIGKTFTLPRAGERLTVVDGDAVGSVTFILAYRQVIHRVGASVGYGSNLPPCV